MAYKIKSKKLKKEEVNYILKKMKFFLKKKNIKYVSADVEEYKKGKGFIDFKLKR